MQQYFVKKKNGTIFHFHDDDLHHINTVLRMKIGQKLICVYEQKRYICKLNVINDRYCAELVEEMVLPQKLSKKYTLYIGIIKRTNFEYCIQKVTELGIDKIVPVIFSRSQITNIPNHERSKRIVKSASEQSKRTLIPEISDVLKFDEMIELLQKHETKLMAYENEESLKIKHVSSIHNDIAIIIGPEGGITMQEHQRLLNLEVMSVKLTDTILRSETASVFLLSNLITME